MNPDPQSIRELAYRLWKEQGAPEGRPDDYWFAAEQQLRNEKRAESKAVDEASKESFPASDAPASGLPDVKPANADEKWAARAKIDKTREAARRRDA